MRKRMLGLGLLMVLATFFGGNVWAGVIVDTGPGSVGDRVDGLSLENVWHPNDDNPYFTQQYLAGQFTTTQDYTLTSVKGWLANAGSYFDGQTTQTFTGAGGWIDISIYANKPDPDLPTRDDPKYVSLDPINVLPGSIPGWYGLTGLSQPLAEGTYWVVFAPQAYGFEGKMPSWPSSEAGGPYPQNLEPTNLTGWAYCSDNSGTWTAFSPDSSNYGIGVMIEGNPAVPLPSTLLLLGSGLLGLAGWRRRKKG